MRFIIDAHLPKSLAHFFSPHEVIHTSELVNGNLTPDRDINTLSVLEERILITKDADFYYSYIAARKPHKLVLVKLGNMRLKDLNSYFERNAKTILDYLHTNSFLILEQKRIRILE